MPFLRIPRVALVLAIAGSAVAQAQSGVGTYAWSDLNVPAAGRHYVYTGLVRNSITGGVTSTVQRDFEYKTVESTAGGIRFETSDRVVGTGASTSLFYDVTESHAYDASGDALLGRSTTIVGGFGGSAPQSVAFSSGLIAPPVYVEGQTYTYDGRFTVTTLGGSERRRITVYPLETVTVPAGTFRCVKIGISIDYPANVIFAATGATYWYARDIGVVKARFGQVPDLLQYELDLQSANFPLVAGTFEEAIRITADPESTLTGAGEPLRLRVLAEGAGLTYAWSRNGSPIPGATLATLTVPAATLDDSGVYRVVVANASGGSRQSKDARVTVFSSSGSTPGKLLNVSVSAYARTGSQQLIAGISLQGNTSPHRILFRGAGPALRTFGVSNTAVDPALVVQNSVGAVLGANDDWGSSSDLPGLVNAAQMAGAFAFPTGSADAALVLPIPAGNVTAGVTDSRGGVAIVEGYDLDSNAVGGFANLSARGDTRVAPLVVGWVTSGQTPVRILVRAVGPSLAQFGVSDFAPAPALRVVSSSNGEATNQRWSNSAQLPELRPAMRSAGAFDLLENSADAALIATVPPGNFTAVVDQSSTGGIALIEVYRLP